MSYPNFLSLILLIINKLTDFLAKYCNKKSKKSSAFHHKFKKNHIKHKIKLVTFSLLKLRDLPSVVNLTYRISPSISDLYGVSFIYVKRVRYCW